MRTLLGKVQSATVIVWNEWFNVGLVEQSTLPAKLTPPVAAWSWSSESSAAGRSAFTSSSVKW